MKKNLILTVAIIATNACVFSQTIVHQQLLDTQIRINRDSRDDKGYKHVEGSQYIDANYFKIIIPNSTQTEVAKYNAFTDKIEILNGSDVNELMPEKGVVLSSSDSNKNYIYTDYINKKNESVTGYLDIISDKNSKVLLFKKEQVVLIPEVPAKNPYDAVKPAHFKKMKPEYFIRLKENGGITPLPKNKKEIVKIIPEKEKEINNYIKENKISLSEEKDIIKLTSFLNTIF